MFIPPKNEEVGMENRDVKKRKDRYGAGLGRVYCGRSQKLLTFQAKNIFYTFCNFVPMPLFKFGKHQGKGN